MLARQVYGLLSNRNNNANRLNFRPTHNSLGYADTIVYVNGNHHFLQLTNYCGLKVNKDSPGYVLAGPSLTEEGVEGIITASNGLVTGHLTIRLDTVFQTVQFPAGIAHLDSSLANVD